MSSSPSSTVAPNLFSRCKYPLHHASSARSFILPNLLSRCKYPLHYHPKGDVIASDSDNWYRNGFSHFTPQQEARLSVLLASNLSAAIYDDANEQHLRASCDLMNLILLYGDFTDDIASKSNQLIADYVTNIFKDPRIFSKTPDLMDEEPVIKLSRDFWLRCLKDSAPGFRNRFVQSMTHFLDARRQQAKHRDTNIVPSLNTYINIRRNTSGLKPLIDFLEYTLQIDLPDEVLNHPVLDALKMCTNDFVTWSNDIYSYNKEQARGDVYNMVAILMHTFDMDLQNAVDAVGEMCFSVLEDFDQLKEQLPSWGSEIDEDVARYVRGLENWLIACLHFSFISGRYFGKDGPEIRKTRVVKLLPKKTAGSNSLNNQQKTRPLRPNVDASASRPPYAACEA